MITITHGSARMILDALDVAIENIALDRLNDDEDEFADIAMQVGVARDFLALLIGEKEHGRGSGSWSGFR